MLNLEEGKKAVRFARKIIESTVDNKNNFELNIPEAFNEKHGAFVTIHKYPNHQLRGCIGIPLPSMSLKKAISEAGSSATHDPRFTPLSEDELDEITIEVTVLTKPKEIKVSNPKEYPSEIKIGRDGLIVHKGINKGLLLPQVPVEQDWGKDEFLSHTCIKAGLSSDAWLEKDVKISKFSGQIFSEIEPRGEIKEKKIDGSSD
ncbi:MAG: TIGR00296 family protein [Candidatus Thermoplasmatota archaeon]